MATNKELEQRIGQLEASLRQATELMERAGLVRRPPSTAPEDRPDYWPFGGPQHAALLGLVLVEDGAETPQGQRTILSGAKGQLYCLEDEIGAMRMYPGLSLDEVVPVILRQKINVFEAGPPPVPANAPPMWTPEPILA